MGDENKGSYYHSGDESDMKIALFPAQYCYTEEMEKSHFLLQSIWHLAFQVHIAVLQTALGGSNSSEKNLPGSFLWDVLVLL